MADTVALPDLVGRVRLDTRGLDKSLQGIRNAIAGAFVLREVKNFVSNGISELTNLERISAQTAAVIKSTGEAAGVSVQHVVSLSESIEKTTTVEKENVQAGANMLLTFTNIRNAAGEGNDIFDQAVHSLTDFSTAMGEDAQTAAIRLGKALQDPILGVTALRRVGVAFTDAQKDQIKTFVETGNVLAAQKVILAEVNKEFGGSAEALGNTFQGRLNRVHEQFRDLGESVAKTVLPAVGALIKIVGPLLDAFTRLPAGVQTSIVVFTGLSTVALALVPIIGAVKATLSELSFTTLGPLGLALGAASLAVGVFASSQDKGHQAAKNWADALREDNGVLAEHSAKLLADSFNQLHQLDNLRAAGVTIAQVSKALDANTSAQDRQLKKAIQLSAAGSFIGTAEDQQFVIKSLKDSTNAYDQLLVKIARKGQLDEGVYKNLEAQKKALAEGRISQADYNKVVGDAEGGLNGFSAAADGAAGSVGGLGGSSDITTQKLQNLSDAVIKSFSSQRNYDSALRGIERANLAVASAAGTDAKSTQSLSSARDKAAEAAQRLKSAQDGLATAQDRVASAQDGIVAANKRRTDAEEAVQTAISQTVQAEAELSLREADVGKAQVDLTRILSGYGAASQEAADAVDTLNKALRDQESSQLDLADAQDALKEAQNKTGDAVASYGGNSIEALKANRDLERAQIGLGNAQDNLKESTKKATAAQTDLNETVNGAPSTSDKAKAAADKLTEAQKAQKDASDALVAAHKAELSARDGVTDATKGQTAAAKALTKAQDDVKDATSSLALVQARNATSAMDGYGASTKSATQRALDLRDALDQQSAAYDTAAAAAGDKALEEANAAALLNGQSIPAQEQLRIKLQAQFDEYVKLRDSLAPGSPLRANIQGHIDDLAKVPGIVRTDVRVDLGQFHEGIKNLFAGIAGSFANFFNPLASLLPGKPQLDVGHIVDAIRKLVPVFHEGGVMPGAPGSQGLALLRAGEVVLPTGVPVGNATTVYVDATFNGVQNAEDIAPQLVRLIKSGIGAR